MTVLRSVEQSLERLGLDRVDILYLHDPDEHWSEASTTGMDALIELRDQGVVRAIGAGMNQSAMLTEFVRRCDVDLIMCAGRWTLLDRSAGEDLLPLALERGVGVVAAGVFNSGLLGSDRVIEGAAFDYAAAAPELIELARRLAQACEVNGTTLPSAAIQFPMRHPAVVGVVLGMRTVTQVRSNVERSRALIPERVWERVREILEDRIAE